MILRLKNSGVFAVESLWYNQITRPYPSVDPLFKVIKDNVGAFNYTVLNCNTREELMHSLELAKRNSSQFRTLYFASHGHPYGLQISQSTKERVSLDELAKLLKTDFSLWAIHFGACSVLDVEETMVRKFMDKTKVRMVTGYGTDVDWMESASLELLFFSHLTQYYDDLDSFRELWYNRYNQFSEINKFRWHLKES